MANSIDPDQTEQSDLGLHSLPRPVCPKTEDNYSNLSIADFFMIFHYILNPMILPLTDSFQAFL